MEIEMEMKGPYLTMPWDTKGLDQGWEHDWRG